MGLEPEEFFLLKMIKSLESGKCMSKLPSWLRDFVGVVEIKQHQGYVFYVNGEISHDALHIVQSMYDGVKINAFKQKN